MKIVEQNEWEGRSLTVTWDDAPTLPPREQITQASGVCFVSKDKDNDNGDDEPLIVLVGSGDGRWSLPGGHPEVGETMEAAFRREVLEEACAVVEECGYLGAQRVDDLANIDTGSTPYYQTRFWARVRLLPFAPQHEMTERRLVRPDAFVATLNWNTSKTAQAILETALRKWEEAKVKTTYTLRPATPSDLPFFYEVVRATVREHVEATWGSWDENWQRARFANRFIPEHWKIILIGGVAAGGLALEARDAALFLANLHLLPEHQGRGIGTAVLHELQADAAARDLPLTLNVLRSNDGAKRLYERLGFRIVKADEERWWLEWTATDASASESAAGGPRYSTFQWTGSDMPFLDAPNVAQCRSVVIGRYGGSTASGAHKNEDAALVFAAPDGAWTFAALLDAHGSSESANLVMNHVAALEAEVVALLGGAETTSDAESSPLSSLWELTPLVARHFADDAFRRACAAVRGETALLLVAQRGAYLWWLSIGDIPVYVFYPDFARLGQFALNQRMFFEWVGQVNTFALPQPCYATGVRQLRPGINRILLTTDGLLECGARRFENPDALSDFFAHRDGENRDGAEAVHALLEQIHEEQGRDSATLIAWDVNLLASEETMQPSA